MNGESDDRGRSSPDFQLSKKQLRHINCILGDLISLYNPRISDERGTFRWWTDKLYAFTHTKRFNPDEVDAARRNFQWFTEYLGLAYPERLFKKLEAYLWSEPIRELLIEPLGFLEGNFLIIQPNRLGLIQPHIDKPFVSIRLPHVGFKGEGILELTVRRIGSVEELDSVLPKLREYFLSHRPFSDLTTERRQTLYETVVTAIQILVAGGTQGLADTHLEAKRLLKEVLPLLKNAADHHPVDKDDERDDFLAERLLESSLYLLTNIAIKEFRKAYRSDIESTEFLKFLKGDEPLTPIQQETSCLYMEDGEVSLNQFTFQWLAWKEKRRDVINFDPLEEKSLIKAGLIADEEHLTERAYRMARWVQKVVGVRGGIDEALTREYTTLVNSPIRQPELSHSIWNFLLKHWAPQTEKKKRDMAFALDVLMGKSAVPRQGGAVGAWRGFTEEWLGTNRERPTFDQYRSRASANWGIHEFLRRNETGPRSFIAFPLTDLLDATAVQAVFLGTCDLGQGLEGTSSEEINEAKTALRERISLFKNFLTIVGKPIITVAVREEEIKVREDAVWAEILPNIGHAIAAPLARLNFDLAELQESTDSDSLRTEIHKIRFRLAGAIAIKDLLLFFKEKGNLDSSARWKYGLCESPLGKSDGLQDDLELNLQNLHEWIEQSLRYVEVEGKLEHNEQEKAALLREAKIERVSFSSETPQNFSLVRMNEESPMLQVASREQAILKVILQELIINAIKYVNEQRLAFCIHVSQVQDEIHIWVINTRAPRKNPVLSLDHECNDRISGLMLIKYSIEALGWSITPLSNNQEIKERLGNDPGLGNVVQAFHIIAPLMRYASC